MSQSVSHSTHSLSRSLALSLVHKNAHIATVDKIVKELETPIETVIAETEAMSHTELDELNAPIKSYINNLSSMKASLATQLKEIEESEAYLKLGVNKEMSDAEIKKAYHSLAIKVHPDKPGGDTAKFQSLQASYQEIVAKRQTSNFDSKLNDLKSSSLQGAERAHEIATEIQISLEACRAAAEQIGALAQMGIQLVKMAENAISTFKFPQCASAMYRILLGGTDSNMEDIDFSNADSDFGSLSDVYGNMTSLFSMSDSGPLCMLTDAIEPTETVADQMQSLSSKTVELTSCGVQVSYSPFFLIRPITAMSVST